MASLMRMRSPIIFSMSDSQDTSPAPPNRKPTVRRINLTSGSNSTTLRVPAPSPSPASTSSKQVAVKKDKKQPSVAQVERAIGAGIYRDRDVDSEAEESKTMFDTIFLNTIGKSEGPMEKKLRETGEWIIHQTEGASRSAGDNVLKAMFMWILPMWIISFILVSGFVKLPFNIPLLDDLIL